MPLPALTESASAKGRKINAQRASGIKQTYAHAE